MKMFKETLRKNALDAAKNDIEFRSMCGKGPIDYTVTKESGDTLTVGASCELEKGH